MAWTISLSDEYQWSAQTGLVMSVLEFLRDSVEDPDARRKIERVLDYQLGYLDVQDLPATGREDVLRRLRTDLPDWAEAMFSSGEGTSQRSTVGHIKVLTLMARDIGAATDEDDSASGEGPGQIEGVRTSKTLHRGAQLDGGVGS
ncbi:hypothetical protein A8W25_30830 [Streptomyces sp. ERV7]|uniref:hypothetical protein n=1 Tax=Streptomyces sp. ERV7 TaxID=1322334 RepID=UPI0007F493D8|nr:hypothetical protein [Streptomyces sp. ERV7]OAR21874.1 hypothetical protein A8W25_30830 [Streptomyces sp. ERV7]